MLLSALVVVVVVALALRSLRCGEKRGVTTDGETLIFDMENSLYTWKNFATLLSRRAINSLSSCMYVMRKPIVLFTFRCERSVGNSEQMRQCKLRVYIRVGELLELSFCCGLCLEEAIVYVCMNRVRHPSRPTLFDIFAYTNK